MKAPYPKSSAASSWGVVDDVSPNKGDQSKRGKRSNPGESPPEQKEMDSQIDEETLAEIRALETKLAVPKDKAKASTSSSK